MTVNTQKTVWCDGEDCDEWVQFSTSRAARARDMARNAGWASHSGGDFCPDCNAK